MSRSVVSAVLDSALPSDEKFILSIMADWADDEGRNVYPSVERVAWKATKSVRRTRSTIARLRARSILVPMGSTSGGRGRTTRYRIALDALPARAPFVPSRRGDPNTDDPSGFPAGPKADDPGTETRTSTTAKADDLDTETRTPASADPEGDPDRSTKGINSLRAREIVAAGAAGDARKRALYDLRTDCTAQPITYADNDYLNDAADALEDGDVDRIREEVGDARAWPLAKAIIGRVVAARRDGRDPWARRATERRASTPASRRVGEGRSAGVAASRRRSGAVGSDDDLPPGAVRG